MNKNNATAEKIFSLLKKHYPIKTTALQHNNPLQLLVATILSAQCTDKRVNIVTKKLFKKYKTVKDFANANLKELEKEIFSTGFYHNKAKHIIASAKKIENEFNGIVPDSMEKLVQLPGVARKTANIVLSAGFGKIEGIAVDTHVMRLSQRIGLSDNKTSEKIELDLMKLFLRKNWFDVSNLLIAHGRSVCFARKPQCTKCFLNNNCKNAFNLNSPLTNLTSPLTNRENFNQIALAEGNVAKSGFKVKGFV